MNWAADLLRTSGAAIAFQNARSSSSSYARRRLKDYKFPEICPEDCEQQNIRGEGPGGSCVNSAGNAVMLKHKPTNCVVKVHDSRDLHKNIKIAQDRLKLAVDRQLNGQNCYEAQFEQIRRNYEEQTRRDRERRRAQMAAFKAEGDQLRARQNSGGRQQQQLSDANEMEEK